MGDLEIVPIIAVHEAEVHVVAAVVTGSVAEVDPLLLVIEIEMASTMQEVDHVRDGETEISIVVDLLDQR